MRSNLAVVLSDLDKPSVIVTSAHPGEGKTATTVNLARSLATAGNRVVLIDFDLRHPDIHHWVGVPNDLGVTDVLLGESLASCLKHVDVGPGPRDASRGIYVLTAGGAVDNPAELLGTPRTRQMLDELSQQTDVVLIDTPPVLLVSDTLVIGRMVAGALLVIESRKTQIPAAQHAKDALIRNQTRLLGVVINKVQPRDAADGGYGYGYGSGYGYPYGVSPDGGNGASGDWARD